MCMCIVVCGIVLALQCLYFLLATLCLHIYQEPLHLLKTKVYAEAVGVLEQLVLLRDLISLRFVCICTCMYMYIIYIIEKNEQKVGMLLQKKNRYKRSRDK